MKRLLRGDAQRSVVDPGSVDRPELIDWYAHIGAAHRMRDGTVAGSVASRSPNG
ncbi:hypothetical protein [Streptomyces melanosporofaciens]|uniref:hypothetical protein n=1 Tax=Streptomyces melanosporofaciens TaxID=67327 RepID=UPI001431E184|nr:hypothetical protein [Streptomyces melanosporofaciens]